MPIISVNRSVLFRALGREFTPETFNDLCFEFGLELDDVVVQQNEAGEEEICYKVELPANRHDLLCVEGLSRSLNIFQNRMVSPHYSIRPSDDKSMKITVQNSVEFVRPYACAAVLRNVKLNKQSFASWIDLQDKLHQNIGRKRSLVSIGTHDLDTLTPPFVYEAISPKEFKFKPLNQTNAYTGAEIMNLYSGDSHLRHYLPILDGKDLYPIIKDSKGIIICMPPIINSDHSKMSADTKNIFIDITGTDQTKCETVLDILVTMFSEYCEQPYTVESVEVIRKGGSEKYPKLVYRTESIDVDLVNRKLGLHESANEIAILLTRMGLSSKVAEAGKINVEIPPTRPDVMHACDIIEDVAIAYNYDRIPERIPPTNTIGSQYNVNKLTDLLRIHLAAAGFTETLTFALCSQADIADKLGHDLASTKACHISNPKTLEFQVARTTLLPGILKTIHSNLKMPIPMKLFEVSDVVLKQEDEDVGCRNERRLCAVYYNKVPGFEIVQGLLDRCMQLLEIQHGLHDDGYSLLETNDPTYFPGRCAFVRFKGANIGKIGVLHPDVIANFGLNLPCSAFEISLEPFL